MSVRTRIAPSPTGEYHVGHLRTMLYNYALARQSKGKFIIRIEDTDRTRYLPESVGAIFYDIKAYGFTWDEGPQIGGPHKPYTQSERLNIYQEHAQKLINTNDAYYCFCTQERLSQVREKQQKEKKPTGYDGICRKLSNENIEKHLLAGKDHVIRLKVPSNEEIIFEDLVYGILKFNSSEIDDQILVKSDGFPTYHLAVVVDDHLMEITHILRGNDWLSSAPKHVLLYKAFGWQMPIHAHLPNLKEVGGDKKLSKRFGAVAAKNFLVEGYLPEALLNFLMFLGWNPGTEKEYYTMDEFINDFSIEKVNKTDLVAFDRKKLLWMNGHYIRELSPEDLLEKIYAWSKEFSVTLPFGSASHSKIITAVTLVQERLKTLAEFPELVNYFFNEPTVDGTLLIKFAKTSERTMEILNEFLDLYSSISKSNWEMEYLDRVSHDLIEKLQYKPKEAFMSVRVAISGVKATPPLFDTLHALGQDKVVERMKKSIEIISI